MMIQHDLKTILFSLDCNLDLEFENLESRRRESIKKNCTERKGQQVTPIQVKRASKSERERGRKGEREGGREGGARLVSINRQVKQGVSLKQSPFRCVFHPNINNGDHEPPFGHWNIFVSNEDKDR